MEYLVQVGFLLFLLILGYSVGTIAERRHFASLARREQGLLNTPAVTFDEEIPLGDEIGASQLVQGSAVISIDHFKRFLAALINIFGGRVVPYESLVDRARREAILRMKEMVPSADVILNVRIETSSIGMVTHKMGGLGSVEALAYGTAVKFRR